ncbi:MAG TPA: MFS transporter [Methylomirabilota bacterium]|nr:MFS transporter [Methylomirabilota bacterium]
MTRARFAAGGDAWLLAICLSRVGAYMVYISYAAALPVLQREWGMSNTAAGSIASAFQVAYALSLMGCSELADRVGARRVFVVGTLASAVGAAAFALLARDFWSGLVLYTALALVLGGTYTTGILLIAESVPPARRGRAMGFFLGGHSLGLALALVLTGLAIPLGGYRLAFTLTCLGPVVGGAVAWLALRHTPNARAPRAGDSRFGGAVLANRPAMLIVAGYTFHSWELLGMWTWTPAFLAACFVATGSEFTRAAGLGPYLTSLFHVTGVAASLVAGILSDRLGRTPVIFTMAALSAVCSLTFGWLIGGPVWAVVAVGLVYGFTALGDSPIYSTAITEVVQPAYRGAALALRSLAGYGAGAAAPVVFGAILDVLGGSGGGSAAWGPAFASFGVAGLLAVAAAVRLHALPEAAPLTRAAR